MILDFFEQLLNVQMKMHQSGFFSIIKETVAISKPCNTLLRNLVHKLKCSVSFDWILGIRLILLVRYVIDLDSETFQGFVKLATMGIVISMAYC